MAAVQLCLFVMDTHRLPKNLSGRLILETLIISPFKSICMVVTVMSGFNSELYSRDYNRVSFILLVKIALILRAFFISCHTCSTTGHKSVTQRTHRSKFCWFAGFFWGHSPETHLLSLCVINWHLLIAVSEFEKPKEVFKKARLNCLIIVIKNPEVEDIP